MSKEEDGGNRSTRPKVFLFFFFLIWMLPGCCWVLGVGCWVGSLMWCRDLTAGRTTTLHSRALYTRPAIVSFAPHQIYPTLVYIEYYSRTWDRCRCVSLSSIMACAERDMYTDIDCLTLHKREKKGERRRRRIGAV